MATFSTVAKASTKQALPRPTVTISTAANFSIKRSLPRPVAIVSTIAEAKLPRALSIARHSEDGITRGNNVTESDESQQEGTVASDISSTSRLLQGAVFRRPLPVSAWKDRTIRTCSNLVPELQPPSIGSLVVGTSVLPSGETVDIIGTLANGNCMLSSILTLLDRPQGTSACRAYRRGLAARLRFENFASDMLDAAEESDDLADLQMEEIAGELMNFRAASDEEGGVDGMTSFDSALYALHWTFASRSRSLSSRTISN